VADGKVSASGNRADLSNYLPLGPVGGSRSGGRISG